MRFPILLTMTALFAVGAFADAAARPKSSATEAAAGRATSASEPTQQKPDVRTARMLRTARADEADGLREFARLAKLERTPDKLRALRSATSSLRRAWRAASAGDTAPLVSLRTRIAPEFVRALDEQAAIYLGRGSVPQAKERIDEALAILPDDPRSTALAEEVRRTADGDLGVRLTAARSLGRPSRLPPRFDVSTRRFVVGR
jgi:hypothetical protein